MVPANPKKNPRVSVRRNDKVLGEYHPLQMGSLLETGHLNKEDLCLDPDTQDWIPLKEFLKNNAVPGYSRPRSRRSESNSPEARRLKALEQRTWIPWLLALFAMAIAMGTGFLTWKMSKEIEGLKQNIAEAEAKNSDLEEKYQHVLFASREVAASDLVRGKVIIRDETGKRIALPGIKIKLYPRADMETYLADRYARISEAGGTDPIRISAYFQKNLPPPLEVTSTNSDGRFEFKLPKPGEYVLQTNIRSMKTGEIRLWFVAFDSRDPLNTPVDITEANTVRQFNPILMVVDGR